MVENPYGGVVPELVDGLAAGRGHDRMRLSLYEAAAFGANMTVPYGSWMGATIQDSFWAPHDLLVEIQDFIADTEQLRSADSANEVAVVYSVPSIARPGERRPTWATTCPTPATSRSWCRTARSPRRCRQASVPFDVVLLHRRRAGRGPS